MKNRDLKTKNTWMKAAVVYLLFDGVFSEDAEKVKITFEKIREMFYNKEKEFYIRLQNGRNIEAVFTGENVRLKNILLALLEIREEFSGIKFNMVLSDTETYIYEFERELVVTDRNYELKIACEKLEKKRYLLVPEKSIQKYVNIAKFQKISETAGEAFFNITGSREEATSEN